MSDRPCRPLATDEDRPSVEAELYSVELSDDALFVYLRAPSGNAVHELDRRLELLGSFPYLGHRYDPLYEAATPPFELYVAYAGAYGIYYEVSEDDRRVSVVFIEDQRRNPNDRFSGIRDFYGNE